MIGPALGSIIGVYAAYKLIPVAYRWDLIPGVGSPDWHAKYDTTAMLHPLLHFINQSEEEKSPCP